MRTYKVIDGTIYCVDTCFAPDYNKWETMVGSPASFKMDEVMKTVKEELDEDEVLTDEDLINIACDCVDWIFWDWDLLGLTKRYNSVSAAESGHLKVLKELEKVLA